ncbi:unnamed protein product [Rotaria sp. Silwood1]|nr:unnamed protein product [Rotaria sp. Silwood1]
MTKVTVDTNNYELTEHDSQRVISPTESNKTDQKSVSYDNPVFSDQRPSITSLGNGTLVTTKLEIKNGEADDDDDIEDKNNEGFERLTGDGHKLGLFVLSMHECLVHIIKKEKKLSLIVIKILLLVGFIIFFGFAMSEKYGTPAFPIRGNVFYGNQGFAMFILVACAVFIAAWEIILRSSLKLALIVVKILLLVGFIIFFGFAMSEKYGTPAFPIRGNVFYGNQGFAMFILVACAVFIAAWEIILRSSLIRWKTVLYSFILQFLLAVFVIRVDAGFELFEFLGQEVTKFINNADAGAKFVFGETFEQHFYVFKITSIIIFLGSVINVLYYYGVMQYVIGKLAWLMQKCLNTTAAEVCIHILYIWG